MVALSDNFKIYGIPKFNCAVEKIMKRKKLGAWIIYYKLILV